MRAVWTWVVAVGALVGCVPSGGGEGAADQGGPADGRPAADGAADAVSQDLAPPPDGGPAPDQGPATDRGVPPDQGPTADQGPAPDQGLDMDPPAPDAGPAQDMARPDGAPPDMAPEPDVALPDMAVPDLALPDLALPDMAPEPDMALPDMAPEPDMAIDPDMAIEPDMAVEPGCTDEVVAGLGRVWAGDTTGQPNDFSPSCQARNGADVALAWTAPAAGTYVFDTFGTGHDTVLAVLDGCDGPELACDDDDGGLQSRVTVNLAAGQAVVVVVDGYNDRAGPAVLNIQAQDQACAAGTHRCGDACVANADPAHCGDRCLPCPAPANGEATCAAGACGVRCAVGFQACAEGCCPAPAECWDADVGGAVGRAVFRGPNAGANRVVPGCQARHGDEVIVRFTAPAAGDYTFDTEGSDFDTVLVALWDCDGDQRACNDDAIGLRSRVVVPLAAGESTLLAVDGWGGAVGQAVLNVTAPAGPAVEDCAAPGDEDGDGRADCADPDCAAHPACLPDPEDCAAPGDEDGDGLADCADPDCAEAPACRQEAGQCADGHDNDGDGLTDCADEDCAGAVACCADHDLGSRTGLNLAGGSAGGLNSDDFQGRCGFLDQEERAYRWVAPADGVYLFDTTHWRGQGDTTLYLLDRCDGESLVCNMNPLIDHGGARLTVFLRAGDERLVVVDGGGDFLLSIVRADATDAGRCRDDFGQGGFPAAGCGCIDRDLGFALGYGLADLQVAGQPSDQQPECGLAVGRSDVTVRWTAPYTGRFRFVASRQVNEPDYAPVLQIRRAACDGPVLACVRGDREASAELDLTVGDSVLLTLDNGLANGSDRASLAVLAPTELGCSDGFDDDGDFRFDCFDEDCAAAPNCQPAACPEYEAPSRVGRRVVMGTTAGRGSRERLCGSDRTADARVLWTAPLTRTYTFSALAAHETVVGVYRGACQIEDATELACRGASASAQVQAGETVTVVVDGQPNNRPFQGHFELMIGTPDETGFCDDGQDSDGDFRTDCDDADCFEDPYCADFCAGVDLGSALGDRVAVGDLTGARHDRVGSCQGFQNRTPDEGFQWTAPAAGRYRFDTLGSQADTNLYLLDGDCVGAELACNRHALDALHSALEVDLAAGQAVVIMVEHADTRTPGPFMLNIHPTEAGACADGVDDDGDGLTDCADPDCGLALACLGCVTDDLGDATGDLGEFNNFDILEVQLENNYAGTCGGDRTDERVFRWTAPRSADYRLVANWGFGQPAVIYALTGCAGEELFCAADSYRGTPNEASLRFWADAGQTLLFVVDNVFFAGAYRIEIQ